MDVLSEKGVRYTAMAEHAVKAAQCEHPDLVLLNTPIIYPATVDYMVSKNGQLSGVIEIKVRETGINLYQVEVEEKPVFLSVDKFNKGVQLADHLGVPFFLWIYLPSDAILLSYQVYNPVDGKFITFTHQQKATQRSTNDKSTRVTPIIGIRGNQGTRVASNITPFE